MKPLTVTAITPKQLDVIVYFVDALKRANFGYQITGGLAGNIYGSRWPLHDVDIEISIKDMDAVAELFKEFIIIKPRDYEDKEFRMRLMILEKDSVAVDISAVEDFYVRCAGSWLKVETDLKGAQDVTWKGMQVKVQPLKDIISYKELLGRIDDVADLIRWVK
jgi:hypothetical protein